MTTRAKDGSMKRQKSAIDGEVPKGNYMNYTII